MGSTYSSLLFHVVFATKGRAPLIERQWQDRLYGYMGGVAQRNGGKILASGGVNDHMHLILSLTPSHAVADVVREIKKASTLWVRGKLRRAAFGWQDGYAAISVGRERLEGLRAYLAIQEEHHKRVDSRQELLDLCREAGIEVDLRYFD